jgi:hypothetical protein
MPNSMNPMAAIKHAIDLIKNPAGVMNAYRDSDPSLNSLMINYVGVLAAIAFVATLIGDLIIFRGVYGFLDALLPFISSILGVFIVGYILWKLAPSFGTNTTQIRATRLAAYSYTPYFLISVLNIIPFGPIRDLGYLGLLYGIYIVYLGLPILLSTPKERVISYLIVSLVVVFAVYLVLEVVIGAILLI